MKIPFFCMLLGLSGIALLTTGCEPEHIDPVDPGTDSLSVDPLLPSRYLTAAQAKLPVAELHSGMYGQYFTAVQYTEYALYAFNNREWGAIYAGPLKDLQEVIRLNSDPLTRDSVLKSGSNANQLAQARILRAYYFSRLTDLYGDVPYSEALKGKPNARYDRQEDIYKDLLKELREAAGQFDGGGVPRGDILYDGYLFLWKKFANSLRLILSLRLSKVDPTLGSAEFNGALQDPGGVIETAFDNAMMYFHGASYPNPWYDLYDTRKDNGLCLTLVEQMGGAQNDRRLRYFGVPNAAGQVVGVPYGLTNDSASAFIAAHPDWSFILHPDRRKNNAHSFILMASHVFLARAEAAQRGWTGEDPAALYRAGIQASWEEWGVFDQVAFDAYLNRPEVSLAGGDALKKICTQRWIAFFPDGLQGWSEWRRTGFPELQPSPWALNVSKQIPRRFTYPVSEQNLNRSAYEEAVARIGGDTDDKRMWWDQ